MANISSQKDTYRPKRSEVRFVSRRDNNDMWAMAERLEAIEKGL